MLEGKKVKVSTGGNFDPLPMDRYTVQIIDVNLVTQLKYKSSEEEEVLNYKFVVLDDKPMPAKDGEDGETTRGRFLWRRCRLAINDRSHLGKMAKAVLGRDLTTEEKADFDPESLVGKQVDVMVEQSESKDGSTIYSNVAAFSKTVKKLPFMDQEVVAPQAPIKKTTKSVIPTTAPAVEGEETPDSFTAGLEAEAAKDPEKKEEVSEEDSEEELAALEAAARVAAKKAEMAKKKRLADQAK